MSGVDELPELVERYEVWLERQPLSERTRREYARQVAGFVEWLGADPARESHPPPISGTSSLYASWNGATELASWSVHAGPDPSHLRPIATIPSCGVRDRDLGQRRQWVRRRRRA